MAQGTPSPVSPLAYGTEGLRESLLHRGLHPPVSLGNHVTSVLLFPRNPPPLFWCQMGHISEIEK